MFNTSFKSDSRAAESVTQNKKEEQKLADTNKSVRGCSSYSGVQNRGGCFSFHL